MDPQKIGMAIKKLRLKNGFTQHKLADCLHVTDKAVSKWERGLSVPDVSIVTKLSILLNCDVDNLLEGNLSYLEQEWRGLLILSENAEVFSGSEVYGKPLVYIYLSYFLLAGIGEIFIVCPERDRLFIENLLADGSRFGFRLHFLDSADRMPSRQSTMVVFHNPFIYGPNLTKYFQRAMSRQNGISVLTIEKSPQTQDKVVSFDKHRAIKANACANEAGHCCLPIVFFPEEYADQIHNAAVFSRLHPLYAEPIGNGMIGYDIADRDALLETAQFLRFLRCRMGKDIYDLEMIAKKRSFIE